MWGQGPKLKHSVIVAELAAHQAAKRAALGPVPHPRQPLLDALGVRVRPGAKMLDSITGQVVEVVHGGIIQAARNRAGSA